MEQKAVVISGEAPESDDETVDIKSGISIKYHTNLPGTIIPGEATESDDEGASWSSASTAIDATACAPYVDLKSANAKKHFIKYNSILHKKLHESNESLRNNVLRLTDDTIENGIQELREINKQLVKSELTVQEAACQLRNASERWKSTSNTLFQIIDANFFNTIKINP
ncbi:hypothetical protein HCN44_010392 [Aphidius gifuensis]|uniref:Biogenesis of lysosome-related organelles complex 1 subunit 3 n=1 Tax=Aphidius gifuensis TaxID=684658 RepID=A0A835CUW7_APHGI|nr:uncharacterized protein LOC122852668 isoform X1 [Aphidius gifuensis]XP_044008526.1 uncharacterized protein LOC122852668 isoform X2 [Aphidius gifuensis]KAF7993785.1 hypothetical protein HCN44_010392 [Aphidius gifuensis]